MGFQYRSTCVRGRVYVSRIWTGNRRLETSVFGGFSA